LKPGLIVLAGAAVAVAAAAGWWVGRAGLPLTKHGVNEHTSEPVVYYRDPDGQPAYSLEPKSLADGRAFVAVRAGEDVRFDAEQGPAAGSPSKRVLYYRNPMGLPDISPVPKKDGMGMDYIAVHEGDEAHDSDSVQLTPGKVQRTGGQSALVERRVLTQLVRAPASIKQDERRVAVVSLRATGFIETVEPVTTGDHVRKGQPLFRFYSPEVSAAAAQYASVIRSGSDQQALEGARRRLENLNVPREVLAEIERTRIAPLVITHPVPRDGAVVERNVSDGMRAMPGDVLFRIVDHSVVWVLADIAERDLHLVREGQPVSVRVRGMPSQPLEGKVALIYPHLNETTRTGRIRIELPNPNGALRPEMYADVEIQSGGGAPVLVVPTNAVIDSGSRQIVLVEKGEGRFEPRVVNLGQRGDGFVEVREGIKEHEAVVVSANFLIDAESNLKAALRSLTEGERPQ
jgi:Cu(I)/Ag(I) efflux system membrane fusion protein